jgi:hypothetical protein
MEITFSDSENFIIEKVAPWEKFYIMLEVVRTES